MSLPVVGIVGRPNVGKSSLFNAVLGRRISIVHEQPGVTRDQLMAETRHENCHFSLVDTGGLGVRPDEKRVDVFDRLIRAQVTSLLGEADVLIWVVDAATGVTPQDLEMGDLLRRCGRPVVLAVNKADNPAREETVDTEFAELGIYPAIPVSCVHRKNIDHLLDLVCEHLAAVPKSETTAENAEHQPLKLAVAGRPNVGKSSIVNRLLGRERVMVSDVAGTTRDAVDIPFELETESEVVPMVLIDTAGLRPKRRVDSALEYFSVTRARNAIRRCDVALLILDAMAPGTAQDRRIAHIIHDERKPCIIVGNKWDLIADSMPAGDFLSLLKVQLPFLAYCPCVCASAARNINIDDILRLLLKVRDALDVRIPTGVLNRFLQDLFDRQPPPAVGGHALKLFYATMTATAPPTFRLFVNHKKDFPKHYLQFIENQLRAAFYPEAGLPVRLHLTSRRRPDELSEGKRAAAAGVKRDEIRKWRAKKRHNDRRRGYRK